VCVAHVGTRCARTMHSARTIARPTNFALIGAVHASRHSKHWPAVAASATSCTRFVHPPTHTRARAQQTTHPPTHPPTHTTRLCLTGTHARARARTHGLAQALLHIPREGIQFDSVPDSDSSHDSDSRWTRIQPAGRESPWQNRQRRSSEAASSRQRAAFWADVSTPWRKHPLA
jgi:hypothetical protein